MQEIIREKFWRKGSDGREGSILLALCVGLLQRGLKGLHVFQRIPTPAGVPSVVVVSFLRPRAWHMLVPWARDRTGAASSTHGGNARSLTHCTTWEHPTAKSLTRAEEAPMCNNKPISFTRKRDSCQPRSISQMPQSRAVNNPEEPQLPARSM